MSADPAPNQDSSDLTTDEVLSFDQMPLSTEMRKSLDEMGYERPTPVQAAVFELATAGRDVIVQARTGTGKTTAFGLPLVERLVKKDGNVQALVLCPTRELALQVSREIDRLGKHCGITTVAVYGGAAMGRQIDQINSGAQIIVGTPGRTLDHMRRRTLDASKIKTLILDESDEMLSMGFERELSAIIEHLPEERQTLLFSATLPPNTERLAKNKLHDPEILILSGDHIGALEVVHYVYMVSGDKIAAMKQVLETENPESAVIFCNTKQATEQLATALRSEGYESDWLNGDLPQNEREIVMRKTREGKLRFLVATDVAARGIDISHLTHVINYDFPQDAEAYVHRTGRTGRAGNTGTALSLVAPRDIGGLYMLRLTYKIRPIERQLPTQLEQRTRAEADIVVSLASTFAQLGTSQEHRALARRLMTHDQAEVILAGILRAHLSANPELPELSQSRRRGQVPPPIVTEPRRARRSRSRDDDDRKERRPKKAARDNEEDSPRPKQRSRRSREPASAERAPAKAPSAPAAVAKTPAAADEPAATKPAAVAKPTAAKPTAAKPTADKPTAAKPTAAKPTADKPTADKPARTRAPEKAPAAEEVDPSLVELHVDSGRRDGARVQAIKSILVDGGVSLDDVRRVRIRERYTFVEVDVAARDAAIEALTGATIGDRVIAAKVSQRSVK